MNNVSNKKGRVLEQRVARILLKLKRDFPERIDVFIQPEILLQTGQPLRPDFDLRVILPYEEGYYLIECQNRRRSSNTLLSKIQFIREKSARKTFIFVHGRPISSEHREALVDEGVMVYSLRDFEHQFLAPLRLTLKATARIPCATDKPYQAARSEREKHERDGNGTLADKSRTATRDEHDKRSGPQKR